MGVKFLPLQHLNRPRPRSRNKLHREELNNYLRSKLIIVEPDASKIIFPKYSDRDLDQLLSFLKDKGKDMLEFNRKKLFFNYCCYGFVCGLLSKNLELGINCNCSLVCASIMYFFPRNERVKPVQSQES